MSIRFTRLGKPFYNNYIGKRIVKTNKDIIINSSHGPVRKSYLAEFASNNKTFSYNPGVVCLNAAGQKVTKNDIIASNPSHTFAHLRHYRYKTLGEYVKIKMQRGYPTPYKNEGKDLNLKDFFKQNQLTPEKLAWCEAHKEEFSLNLEEL